MIKEVKELLDIPVLANGDIRYDCEKLGFTEMMKIMAENVFRLSLSPRRDDSIKIL